MWLTVKGMLGREWNLNVMEGDTIVQVKAMLWLQVSVETPGEIMLINNMGVLKDEHTLAHYEIKEDTRLSVVFKVSQWLRVWDRICRGILAKHTE